MTTALRRLFFLSSLGLLAACGTSDSGTAPGAQCTAGETDACTCDDGSIGTETCSDDGAFGECVCEGSEDTSTDGGADVGIDVEEDTDTGVIEEDVIMPPDTPEVDVDEACERGDRRECDCPDGLAGEQVCFRGEWTECTCEEVCDTVWYIDRDEDGFGTEDRTIVGCEAPPMFVLESGDCDDRNALVNPDAEELCDGLDNNCNGEADEGVTGETFYVDLDNDGFGGPETVEACVMPEDAAIRGDDCDDSMDSVHPGAYELCDGLDNNCNGEIDEVTQPTSSFITELSIPQDGEGGRDMNGDGRPDNALGDLIGQLSGFASMDVNAEIAAMIDDGSLTMGLAWMDLDNLDNDDTVTLWMLMLEDRDGSAGPPGDYWVLPESFNDEGRAYNELAPAMVTDGDVTTAERPIELPIPLLPGIGPDAFGLRRAILDGQIFDDDPGAALVNAELTGAVDLMVIYEALNGFVATQCPCITPELIDPASGTCVGDARSCSDSTCMQIGQFCDMVLGFVNGAADVDLDFDGVPDALSASIGIEAEGVELNGIVACE